MILCDRFNYDVKFLYTYDEVLATLLSETSSAQFPFKNDDSIFQCLNACGLLAIVSSDYSNVFSLTFLSIIEQQLYCSSNAMTLLNKLWARYGEHYAIVCDSEDMTERVDKTKQFFRKLFNKLDYSFAKYDLLLTKYNEQKSHLLDKLGRTRSGSRTISQSGQSAENSVSLYNDTPQTTDVVATIEGNQFVSDLTKNSSAGSTASNGSDTFSETDSWDTMTNMAKLDEIEKQFSQLWKKWLNEFDELFIEEVNY